MRILQIDCVCKYGSTGEMAYNIYNYINSQGDIAAIFYGRGERIEEKNIYKFGVEWETNFHALMARLTGYNGFFSIFSTQRLLRAIDQFQPDIIHIHELHAYFVNIKPLIEYIKTKGIPVVWTFHCEYMYTGKCGYAGSCEKWKSRCDDCPAVKDYPKSLFFDQTRNMFVMKKRLLSDLKAIYITPSDYFAERVRNSFLRGKPVRTIHNGINTNIYHPRFNRNLKKRLGIPKDNKVVISVAPRILSDRKGGNWVIELAKRNKDANITYVLVGDRSKVTKIDSNLIVIPIVRDKNKLAEIYSMADCFVLCSRYETFSMTCAEAICCGTPVAGFKCGAPETIFERPWAEFVDYGDLKSLEMIVEVQMKRDRKEVCEYGKKYFSSETMCSNYMHIYREQVGENNDNYTC